MRGIAARTAGLLLITTVLATCCPTVFAYRPFDGTDAAVADVEETDLELGPAGYVKEAADRTLIAPAAVFNYGVSAGWELVLEGQAEHGLSGTDSTRRLVGNGAFLKHVPREGALQSKGGLSIATEFGFLLPGINAEAGMGASAAEIVSMRVQSLTMHVNGVAAITRQGHLDLFVGSILEGPVDWKVRPVAEVFYEHEFGVAETDSLLLGAIWNASARRTFDIGVRTARVNSHSLTEIRAGLTFGFAA